jgi:hypothetical protein
MCVATAALAGFIGYRAGRRVFVYSGDLVAWDRVHSGDPARVLAEVPPHASQQRLANHEPTRTDTALERTTRHQRADEITSSFQCFGRNFEKNFSEYQTCEYRNLCYFNGKFHFVATDDEERDHVSQYGLNVQLVGGNGMNITRDSEFERKFLAATDPEWAPEVATRSEFLAAIGSSASVLTVPNTHVLYISYNTQNFGHFIGDEIFPAYAVLSAFDAVSSDVQLLRMHALKTGSCDWHLTHGGGSHKRQCNNPTVYDKVGLLSDLAVKTVTEFDSQFGHLKKHGAVCLDRVVAGTARAGDHCRDATLHGLLPGDEPCMRGKHETLWGFRTHVLNRLKLPIEPPAERRYLRPKVLVWNRRNRRVFAGLSELASTIESRFGAEVEMFDDWSKVPLRTQLRNASEAAVYIGGPGGGTFVAWFLPRGGTKIQLNPTPSSGHLDWHIFNNMAHIQTTHIDVPIGVSLDPAKTTPPNNVARQVLAAVRSALKRWRARWPTA